MKYTNLKLAISFSGILCPTDFLMIEIIYDHRMSLRDSAIRHFIIHKGTIILLSHFLSFYFKCFKAAIRCSMLEAESISFLKFSSSVARLGLLFLNGNCRFNSCDYIQWCLL